LWERDELLCILKYEPSKRNKAALTLFWDLDARNHEVTLLKIKHIRLKERYGEGEIPHEAKTGTGPILPTCSFPYVRDWLNEHPFRNESNARLICNSYTGGPIKPEAMWTMMKYLRARIIRLVEERTFTDKEEVEKLQCTDIKEAVKSGKKAIEIDKEEYIESAKQDKAFESIRNDDRFKKLITTN
jgi:hypothetical protein